MENQIQLLLNMVSNCNNQSKFQQLNIKPYFNELQSIYNYNEEVLTRVKYARRKIKNSWW